MSLQLPELPYAYDALAPAISSDTLHLHHGKHHKAYVEKANLLLAGTEFATLSLEDIVVRTATKRSSKTMAALFNNAAQAFNHGFYWRSMKPGGSTPSGQFASRIDKDFRGVDRFLTQFTEAATQVFGSGWTWLVLDRGKLRITSTANADTPLTRGHVPLLTCDVWEHAYYLDHQNRRPEYVQAFVNSLANWDFAAANLERAELKLAAE
ncbi:MAG: superoxide dismutase [Fe] [Alphaproteobacteria bacterium]|nr:superoxide dismutase [Fe] [Alphaproteobacteria bacterium]